MSKISLKGYHYIGRKPAPELHKQIKQIVTLLQDPTFVCGKKWGGELQDALAKELNVKSGQIRTIKSMMCQLGVISESTLKSSKVVDCNNLLTDNGEAFMYICQLEEEMEELDINDPNRSKLAKDIHELCRWYYSGVVCDYYYPNGPRGEGGKLHLLRTILKVLRKYKKLDYWEIYLVMTLITTDDSEDQYALLDQAITDKRSGKVVYKTPEDTPQEKKLAHTYLLAYLELAGFIKITSDKVGKLTIVEGDGHEDIKEEVLSKEFLDKFYKNNAMTDGAMHWLWSF